jgi:hypothetical protein
MKQLTYSASIAAPAKTVWDNMLGPETYQEWTAVAWPGSFYQGEWEPDTEIKFTGENGAGTLARITGYQLYQLIIAEHIALLLPGSIEDRDSDAAKTWVGSIEQYAFNETEGVTELIVTMTIHPQWEDMFNKDWPKALAKLKEMCEAK